MRSEFFKLWELLPPELYFDEKYGWDWFDIRLLRCLDAVRRIVGTPLYVNTWRAGGKFKYRGARIPASKEFKLGSLHSLHTDRKVMAADFHSNSVSAVEIRKMLVDNQVLLPFPVRLEKNVPWVHMDVGNISAQSVYLF